jgi:hypothetical protein
VLQSQHTNLKVREDHKGLTVLAQSAKGVTSMTTTSNIEFTYNGKVYQATEESHSSCVGCAFRYDSDACGDKLPRSDNGIDCCDFAGIWVEKQPETKPTPEATPERTWTLTQIEEAWDRWDAVDGWFELSQRLIDVHKEESLKQDPEYQQYLLLKAKFEEQQ